MPKISDSLGLIAAVIVTAAIIYVVLQLALYRTSLAQRVKYNGFYGCPRYEHTEIVFGSDYPKAVEEATARGRRQAWFRANFARLGKTFEINEWGRRTFLTCDTANVRQILFTQFDHFGVYPIRQPSRSWLGSGVFTTDGSTWRESRDLLRPIFSKVQVSDMNRLDKHISGVMDKIVAEGHKVDLQPLFLKMYLDYSIDLLFGDDAKTISGSTSKLDADAFITACDESLVQVFRARTPWPLRWLYGWTKTWNQPFRVSHEFVEWYVDDALGAGHQHGAGVDRAHAFVDDLVQESPTTDRKYIRDQMLNIFFPARDATGIVISLVIFHLARHPAIYAKVRAEVLQGCNDGLTYDRVKNLKFTNAVVNETLRLYGPVGQVNRAVLADSVLPRGGGVDGEQPIFIPKGSTVIVHMHALQRDEVAWGRDADEFRPERWLESSTVAQRRAWEYLPFLGGPRVCPGQAMVLGQLAYILATFALRFREIRNRDPEQKLIEEHRILMKIRNGVQVELVE